MQSKLSGIKEFLTFSKGERNGIIILIVLIILFAFSPIFYRNFLISIPNNSSDFYTKTDSFFSSLTLKPDEALTTTVNHFENEELTPSKIKKYFFFDPNKASIEDLVQLGLSVKQANVIEKYRIKGGQFHRPDDFSKVYVIDSATFRKLKPWIKIDLLAINSQPKAKRDSFTRTEKTPIIIELNTADTLELVNIKGIGKSYARRIIAYRNLLGGFVNIYQLAEVYGIKPELIKNIASSITIDSSRIKRINLNLVSYEDLKKHPYISDYQSKAIIFYRSKVGNIKNIHELLANKILSLEKYRIIKSYLTIY